MFLLNTQLLYDVGVMMRSITMFKFGDVCRYYAKMRLIYIGQMIKDDNSVMF